MGYSTDFKGELKFNRELLASDLAFIKSFFGEDVRDHPEWGKLDLYYIDLEFNEDMSGVKWDGSEKTYGMVEQINLITREMRKCRADFRFVGQLNAQGEDVEDRWTLIINEQGLAEKVRVKIGGAISRCPHCEGKIVVNELEPITNQGGEGE